jgi:hypothetical protein
VAGGAREGHQVRPQAAGGAAGLLDRGQHQPADPGEAGAAPAEPGQLACTPAAAQYDLLEPADIAIVTLDGEQVDGHKPPTSELRMHRMFCKYRPEIGAIVHTHGKAVMTFANLGWTLPPILTGLCEAAAARCSPRRTRSRELIRCTPTPRQPGGTGALPSCATTACWPSARA